MIRPDEQIPMILCADCDAEVLEGAIWRTEDECSLCERCYLARERAAEEAERSAHDDYERGLRSGKAQW